MRGNYKSFSLIKYIWKGGSSNFAQFAFFVTEVFVADLCLALVSGSSFSLCTPLGVTAHSVVVKCSAARIGKLLFEGQIRPPTCFQKALELRMIFTFLLVEKKSKEV